MNQHRDGLQRVGYREVTTRINESGTHVQTRRSRRQGNGNQRRCFRIIIAETRGHVSSP
jgi:hypothetical protein